MPTQGIMPGGNTQDIQQGQKMFVGRMRQISQLPQGLIVCNRTKIPLQDPLSDIPIEFLGPVEWVCLLPATRQVMDKITTANYKNTLIP